MDYDHCLEDGGTANQFYGLNVDADPFFRELDHAILNDALDGKCGDFFRKYTPTFYRMFSNIGC